MGVGDDNQGIWYMTNVTGTWVKQLVATPRNSSESIFDEGGGPAIAIDPSDGSAWIVFAYLDCPGGEGCNVEGIFLVNNAGGTWTEPVQLTSENTSDPSLTVRDGHVYLAWDQYLDPGGCYTCPSSTWFGTDASGAWVAQSIVGVAQSPQLVVNAEGDAGILFTQVGNRFARQKANGSFVVERVPGDAVGVRIAVDAVSGITWVASNSGLGPHMKVLLTSRGPEGWSDPVMAVSDDGQLKGLGVYDGVVQLIWRRSGSGLMYGQNAGGTFDTAMLAQDEAFVYPALALGPTGRPYVVYTFEAGGPTEIWFLKGPQL